MKSSRWETLKGFYGSRSCDLRLYAGALIVTGGIEYGRAALVFLGAVLMVDAVAEAFLGGR